MNAYLDTHVAVWLAQGDLKQVSSSAKKVIRNCNLLVSPMVELELEYLCEIGRILISSQDVIIKLGAELGVSVCNRPFQEIVAVAKQEKWTRDPFDRIIVSHAKQNGLAPLISADEDIQKHYVKTVW